MYLDSSSIKVRNLLYPFSFFFFLFLMGTYCLLHRSSIVARFIKILFSIAARSIEFCGSVKNSNAKKLITYLFETRIEIHLNQYLKDIISHLLKGFLERETPHLCGQGFVTKFSLFHQTKEFLLYFLYAFGFCNQASFLVPTLKILLVFLCEAVASQLQQSKGCCEVSHVLGSVQRSQSQIGDLCIKGKNATTKSSLIGYWSKCSTVGWYFGIGQGSGKILYTCARLIINQWIIGSSNLKFTR